MRSRPSGAAGWTSRSRSSAIAVDHTSGRVYDSSYPVTARVPRGRASSLYSVASTLDPRESRRRVRAQAPRGLESRWDPRAMATSPRRGPVWTRTVSSQERVPIRTGSAKPTRCAGSWKWLRTAAPSSWRTHDGASPAVRPERGQPGVRAVTAAGGSAHRTRFDSTLWRAHAARSLTGRTVLGHSPRRSAASATAVAPVSHSVPQLVSHRPGPMERLARNLRSRAC
jgi:hypothetical protein